MHNHNIAQYTVSQLSQSLKNVVEDSFGYVKIIGEIGGLKKATSGHLYFSLKENNDILAAVCFRQKAINLKFPLEDGVKITAFGKVTIYSGRSNYQIIIEKVEIAGVGELIKEIELRKQKLLKEGLFDQKHKKTLPFWPEKIGIITSATGAVIEDMKSRLHSRFPTNVALYPVSTQGIDTVSDITTALRFFHNLPQHNQPNIIIIARGGGSFEDLLPFNDEALAREIFKSQIPIISAIGHETDTTIIDFVSDVRAETPTAAIEIATPVLRDLKSQIINLENILSLEFKKFLSQKEKNILSLERQIIHPLANIERKQEKVTMMMVYLQKIINFKLSQKINAFQALDKMFLAQKFSINDKLELVSNLYEKIENLLSNQFIQKQQKLDFITKLLASYDYQSVLQRGYCLVRNSDNKIINSIQKLKNNDKVSVEMTDGVKDFIILE